VHGSQQVLHCVTLVTGVSKVVNRVDLERGLSDCGSLIAADPRA